MAAEKGLHYRQHSHRLKQVLICQERPTGGLKMYENHLSAGTSPWILLGEHTALLRPPS